MDHLSSFKKQFDPLFLEYLKRKCDELPGDVALFVEIRESLLSYAMPGKRLRPYIAYCASGASLTMIADHPILQILFGIELYHLFALIHDDIVDRSDTRHGMDSIQMRFGTNHAILIGDLCMSWAHECAANGTDDAYASVIFSAMSEETIIGQMLDIALAKTIVPTESLITRAIELKTARYTFIYPLFLGRVFDGDSTARDTSPLVRYSRLLGHAFQRLNDLSDVEGTDFKNGSINHIWLYIQEHGTAVEQSRCSMLFGNRDASPGAIQALLHDSGAYAHEAMMIQSLLSDARTLLRQLSDPLRWEPMVAMLEHTLAAL